MRLVRCCSYSYWATSNVKKMMVKILGSLHRAGGFPFSDFQIDVDVSCFFCFTASLHLEQTTNKLCRRRATRVQRRRKIDVRLLWKRVLTTTYVRMTFCIFIFAFEKLVDLTLLYGLLFFSQMQGTDLRAHTRILVIFIRTTSSWIHCNGML